MNRNHVAIFRAVAESGSFSGGAEVLGISQPAVSQQVGELETSLGVRLFDRLGRGIRLTRAGEVLAGHARRIGAIEEEAERAIAELRGLRRGRLAIGASTTIGVYLLPDVLGEFRRRHPRIELELEIGNTQNVQEKLAEGLVDVGLTEGFVEAREFDSVVFREDDLVAIAPPGHRLLQGPVAAKRLCAEPFVMRERGSGTRAVIERALADAGLSVEVVMSLGSTEAVKRAVASGIGVAIVSGLTVANEIRSGTLGLVRVSDLSIRRPLHLLRPRGRSDSPAVKQFLKLVMPAPGDGAS